MKTEETQEIIECLGDERKIIYFYPNKYWVDALLRMMQGQNKDHLKLQDIKNSPLARCLQKPVLKDLMASCGNGVVTREQLECCWAKEEILPFTLTLGQWGDGERGWDQTTRNASNLVLQLNFSNQHDAAYNKLIQPQKSRLEPFNSSCHPINEDGKNTLAWARLDVAFETNEVLIEEIQMDWIRDIDWIQEMIRERRARDKDFKIADTFWNINGTCNDFDAYNNDVIKPYRAHWQEAMMTATLNFVQDELGLSRIYYHSFETGKAIKAVGGEPPRSLYTQLPKKFGFVKTGDAPEMVLQDKRAKHHLKKIKTPEWQVLAA